MKNKKRGGFSLIELMVVIIILGLLASFVMPNIMGKGEQAKQKLACTQMKSMSQSVELFKQDNGSYPETEEGLEALVKNPDSEKYSGFMPGGYFAGKKVPKDPWKHNYVYSATEDGFDIMSFGGDGKEGGEEEKRDIILSQCENN
ncbi:MAG: type II secretion system major pseudopilin GspG [Campylobacterales bacterium]|nr:type II secretion system major pseudopilin GspG [Campylobacterales bacterium]